MSLDFLEIVLNPNEIQTVRQRNLTITEQSELVSLDLSGLGICKFPEGFQLPPSLEVFVAIDCQIENLDRYIFHPSSQLKQLMLRKNRLTALNEEVFTNISQLRRLDLSLNKLQNIPGDLFEPLTMLTHLNLEANDIASLDRSLFVNNPDIEDLMLTSNDLDKSSLKAISHLKNLKKLSLANNPRLDNLGKLYTTKLNINKLLNNP